MTVTISLGVTLVDLDEPDPRNRACERVDTALYESKNAGRDRVSVLLREETT
jgi:PleD family two-component response regulator